MRCDSCKRRPAPGKAIQPRCRVQGSSHPCTVSLAWTLDTGLQSQRPLQGWTERRPVSPQASTGTCFLKEDWGEPPLGKLLLRARRCAALLLSSPAVVRAITPSGSAFVIPTSRMGKLRLGG